MGVSLVRNHLKSGATTSVVILSLAVIGYSFYVAVILDWAVPISIIGPLVSIGLILVGSLKHDPSYGAAWLGTGLLFLWGLAFVFSIGIPFLIISFLLIIALVVMTPFGNRQASMSRSR